MYKMTILEQANIEIQELKNDLAFGDQAKIAKILKLSYVTVNNVTRGKVLNPDTVIRVKKAMARIINKRKKALAS